MMDDNIIEIDQNSIICVNSSTPDSKYFDEIIGHIEDIVIDEEFQILQRNFFEQNWEKVENTEENKFEYMDIFNEYTRIIESYLINGLQKRITNFDMERFAKELQTKRPTLDGEIFDLLLSLMDFVKFKEMILDYRAEKEDLHSNLDFGITIFKLTTLSDTDSIKSEI